MLFLALRLFDGFLIVVAPDSTVLYVTENVTRFIGLTQTEVVGHSLLDLMHGDDQNSVEINLMYDPTGLLVVVYYYVHCCLLVHIAKERYSTVIG